MASIRSDYQPPVDFQAKAKRAEAAAEARTAAEARAERDKAEARERAERDNAREERLRDAWERLPDADREAIRTAVKTENPGIGRWKTMLEPLCLAALEVSARIGIRPASTPMPKPAGRGRPASPLPRGEARSGQGRPDAVRTAVGRLTRGEFESREGKT